MQEDLDTKYESESIAKVYAECDNISIDYGLMERASKVCVIPTVMGWSDVGNWGAVYDLSKKGPSGQCHCRTKYNCSGIAKIGFDC